MIAEFLIFVLMGFSIYVRAYAKAWGDWVLFRNMDNDNYTSWIFEWIRRDGLNNGNPLKCGMWHFCEHIKLFTMLSLALSTFFLGAFLVITHRFTLPYLVGNIAIGWFLYWGHGRIFTYHFHTELMADWSLDFWVKDTFSL